MQRISVIEIIANHLERFNMTNQNPTSTLSSLPKQESIAQKHYQWQQALASIRIEGHEPDDLFLADVQANINGHLSDEQMIERTIKRGLEAQQLVKQQATVAQNTQQWLDTAVEGMKRMTADPAYLEEVSKRVYGLSDTSKQ
jgi:hypothetical protein